MFESPVRAGRGHRSYRDVVADGQAQLATVVERCPNCGTHFNAAVAPPVGLPERDEAGRVARRRALAPTAQRLATRLRSRVSEGSFAIWVGPLVLDDATSEALFLAAPAQQAQLVDWIADRYGPLLAWAAETLAGRRLTIEVYPGGDGAPTLADLLADTAEAVAA